MKMRMPHKNLLVSKLVLLQFYKRIHQIEADIGVFDIFPYQIVTNSVVSQFVESVSLISSKQTLVYQMETFVSLQLAQLAWRARSSSENNRKHR